LLVEDHDFFAIFLLLTYFRMGMQWMVEDKRKSLEKIKYKFKLVYLLGIKIPLSLWFLMIGFEPEAMFLTPILELTLFSILERFLFSTDPGYVSKRRRWFQLGVRNYLRRFWKTCQDIVSEVQASRTFGPPCWKHTRWRQCRRQIIRRIVRHRTGPRRTPSQLPFLLYANIAKRHNRTVPTPTGRETAIFDGDSYEIMVDNCCSACITNQASDFVGTPTPIQSRVKGIGGPLMVTAKGTIKWSFEDDQGRKHTFLIPGSYLAPGAPGRLLSPQHWSKVTGSNTRDTKGTWQATYDDKVVLHWNENTAQRTVLLDPFTNVATIRSAPGNKAFRIYKAMMDARGG
jgi:hypothetical protein